MNRVRFHYRESGSPDATPTMVLHGIMGVAREWDILTAALASEFRTLAVDQRGHGETEWTEDYRAIAMADDIAGLADVLGFSQLNLIGHSMGGMAALLCAADRPDLVGRLVVIDIGPDSLTTDWAIHYLPAMLGTLADASYPSPEEAVAEWLAIDPLASETLMRNYVRHSLTPRGDGRLVWRFDATGLQRFGKSVTPGMLWEAIDRIDVPMLLIRGEHSELLSRTAAVRVVDRLARGELTEIPDGGHDLGVEQQERVTSAVLDFLCR